MPKIPFSSLFPSLPLPSPLRGDEKKNTWIKDLNERPSVVFVSSPTLRCGDGVEMLYSLRNNPNNTLLLTEPNLDVGVAIGKNFSITILIVIYLSCNRVIIFIYLKILKKKIKQNL